MSSMRPFASIFVSLALVGVIIVQTIRIVRLHDQLAAFSRRLSEKSHPSPGASPSSDDRKGSPSRFPAPNAGASSNAPAQENLDFRQKVIRGPEFQQNLMQVMDDRLKRRYEALFSVLTLSPSQQQELWQLLAQGLLSPALIPSTDHRKQATLEEAEFVYRDYEAKIRQLIGTENYRLYREYRDQLPVRNTLEDISRALAATGNPLDIAGFNSLRAVLSKSQGGLLAEAFPSVDAVRSAISGSVRAPISAELLSKTSSWLTPTQRAVLANMSAQQNAIDRDQQLKDSLNLPIQLPQGSFR